MAKVFRTSRGEAVDMDMLRLSNEQTIAIGNMRTNARGDELGKGGQVVKSKAQIMQEYHKLNTPMANNEPVRTSITQEQKPVNNTTAPVATDTPVASSIPSATATEYVKPRGSLADAVAKKTEVNPRGSLADAVAEQTDVTQELLEPASSRNSNNGITRI